MGGKCHFPLRELVNNVQEGKLLLRRCREVIVVIWRDSGQDAETDSHYYTTSLISHMGKNAAE